MIIFDLNKASKRFVGSEFKNKFYFSGKSGYISGKTLFELPNEWTLLFSFCAFNTFGSNATLFEFGRHIDNNGFGCYLNQDMEITFRVNNDFDHYKQINTKIKSGVCYYITIIKKNDEICFFINNELKYSTTSKIFPFNVWGAFSRGATFENKDEHFVGLLSNVCLFNEVLSNEKVQAFFNEYKKNGIKCPNCGSLFYNKQMIPFIPRPCGTDKKTDEMIEYDICDCCGTIFSSEMMQWDTDKFALKCYNKNYKHYDMDIVLPYGFRTVYMRDYITKNFNKNIKHLDYGGNKGFLSSALKECGYSDTRCYDPFTSNNNTNPLNEEYDLVTCVEVVEHAYNVNEIFDLFAKLVKKNGKLIVTTCFYNQEKLSDWWYCNPRVGHILFFTKDGFSQFAGKHGFRIEKIEKFQNQQLITLSKTTNVKIDLNGNKKVIDYLKPGGKYQLHMGYHGLGDVVMFYPIFRKLQKDYPDCIIDFKGRIGQEYFDEIKTDNYDIVFEIIFPEPNYKDMSKVELCCVKEIGIPFTEDIDYTWKPNKPLRNNIIGVNFIVDSNSRRNLNYQKAKKVWEFIKKCGFIPLEVIFYHPCAKYKSEKYDFIDFTTRGIKAKPETTLDILSSCAGFIGVNSGTLVMYSSLFPEKAMHLNTSYDFKYYKKTHPIQQIDCHGELNLDEIKKFLDKLRGT